VVVLHVWLPQGLLLLLLLLLQLLLLLLLLLLFQHFLLLQLLPRLRLVWFCRRVLVGGWVQWSGQWCLSLTVGHQHSRTRHV
jgi:hypothetical protein